MIKHYCDDCGKDITFEKTSSEQRLTRRFWTTNCGSTDVKKDYELCAQCSVNFRRAVDKLMAKFEKVKSEYYKDHEEDKEQEDIE